MLGAAVLSQLGGQMGVIWSLRYLPATVTSVALLAQPVGTALLGWWLLGESITGIEALGGAAVLVGISLASRSALARRQPDASRLLELPRLPPREEPGMSLETFIEKRAGRFSRKLVTPS